MQRSRRRFAIVGVAVGATQRPVNLTVTMGEFTGHWVGWGIYVHMCCDCARLSERESVDDDSFSLVYVHHYARGTQHSNAIAEHGEQPAAACVVC